MAGRLIAFVAAAEPARAGQEPARPPMTMLLICARGPEESSEHQEAESDRVDVGPRRGDVARRGHEQQERVDAELHQLDVVRDWHENSARAKRTSVLNLC